MHLSSFLRCVRSFGKCPYIFAGSTHVVRTPLTPRFLVSHRNECGLRRHFSEQKQVNIANFHSSQFTRSHNCGELRTEHEGKEVQLCGWVHSYRRFGKLLFLVIRDMHGSVQVSHNLSTGEEESELDQILSNLPLESVVHLTGTVKLRPSDMINSSMQTGNIEVALKDFKILNVADPLPFDVRASKLANEELRLRYRFLDLRRPELQKNLRVRSQVAQIVRNFLWGEGFTEIETPTLFRTTVESGAKEFIVPTRYPGKFYALPQSPQQYKQILMASGFDKYFQIARCYRDEGFRSDRQPEFTQVDLEMSFIKPEHIYSVIEGLLTKIWKQVLNVDIPAPFPHMNFDEAIARFGSDKPDTRYAMEISDVTNVFANSNNIPIFSDALKLGHTIKALNIKRMADVSAKECKIIEEEAKLAGAKGIIIIKVQDEWKQTGKLLSQSQKDQLVSTLGVEHGDLLLLSTGPHLDACLTLGRLRIYCASLSQTKGVLAIPSDKFNFLWVVNFPLFSLENSELVSTHHPFTAPWPEDMHLLRSSDLQHLLKIRGLHYDIVLNGVEIGGGSIRVHDPAIQRKIFEKLNFSPTTISQFSHLLEALRYGCPPHGGLALGFDRLISIICKSSSLREVIAFPKTSSGNELMTGAPSEVSKETLQEMGLGLLPHK